MSEALTAYVRDVADRMGLRDWRFAVSDAPGDEPENAVDGARCATFAGTFGRRYGYLWVNMEYWRAATPEERRQTIVHELLHAHQHGAREIVLQLTTVHPARTAAALRGVYDTQVEYAIDAVADALALAMPLPPEGC